MSRLIFVAILALFLLPACNAFSNVAETVELEPETAQDDVVEANDAPETVVEPTVAEVVVEPEPTTPPVVEPEPTVAEVVEEPAPAEAQTVAYNGPSWASLPLTNARTGEAFTLADFAGKVVFIEPMATWCPNCRAQQRVVDTVIPQLDADQYVFISMSVEPGLANDRLASYADQNGFDQLFTVATPELTSALVEQFGRGVTTPPSTPHFIIGPDGSLSALSTGRHAAESIVAEVTAFAS